MLYYSLVWSTFVIAFVICCVEMVCSMSIQTESKRYILCTTLRRTKHWKVILNKFKSCQPSLRNGLWKEYSSLVRLVEKFFQANIFVSLNNGLMRRNLCDSNGVLIDSKVYVELILARNLTRKHVRPRTIRRWTCRMPNFTVKSIELFSFLIRWYLIKYF